MLVTGMHNGQASARDVPVAQQGTSAADRVRQIWPMWVVGVGLLATIAWMAGLSWMLYRVVQMLLA